MPQGTEDMHLAYVTLSGPDRVGLISAVTAALFDLGANLADTNFAVLGTGFEFNAVCELQNDIGLDDIEAGLAGLDELSDADIVVEPFEHAVTPADNARITHVIDVTGGDRPGLIARVTEAFLAFDANIVRMNSARQPGSGGTADYVTRFEVSIPAERAEQCLAAVSNSANQLSLTCNWRLA
ncbi:MAG: glycine cleavage system protein R [Alphaproteobacteria bacterium]